MANILTKQIMDHIVQKCAKDLAESSPGVKSPARTSSGSHLTERHAAMLSELLNKKGQAADGGGDKNGRRTDLESLTSQSRVAAPSKSVEPASAKNANVVHGRAVSLDELLGRLK